MDTPWDTLSLTPAQRKPLWDLVVQGLENYRNQLETYPVYTNPTPAAVTSFLKEMPLGPASDPSTLVEQVLTGMTTLQLHSAHPLYFGVFNPHPSFLGILGDLMASAFNSQLASTASGLLGIEMERSAMAFLAGKAGWNSFDGTFCSGGTEANLTALLCALGARFHNVQKSGVHGLVRPTLYVSSETHHSIHRAARVSGLGSDSVSVVPAKEGLFDPVLLRKILEQDKQEGKTPFFLVATLGTTSSGAIDPLRELSQIAQAYGLWLHVDAAWGAGALLLPEMQSYFEGLERADSLTVDAHKWFSVPMGAGIFLTRHPKTLEKTFRVDESPYMPPDSAASTLVQPYAESLQWSRRLTGLKFYMTLAVAGEEGYRKVFRHQIAMAQLLRKCLEEAGWVLKNKSPWPVVCFTHRKLVGRKDVLAFVDQIQKSGEAWVTSTEVTVGGEPQTVVRAGIPSFSTQAHHVEKLVLLLEAGLNSPP